MNQQTVRTIDALFDRIEKVADDQIRMSKTIDSMGRGRADREDKVVKALLDGRGGHSSNRVAIGFDGADTAQLIEISSYGRRQKSLGMGEDLRAMWVASSGDPIKIGWKGGDVHKHLDSSKFQPIQKTALAEGSGITGGYGVAPQFYMDLLRLAVEEAQVRPRCTTIPMQSRSIFIPALDQSKTPITGTTAFLGGITASWQPEAASINETEPIFRQMEMVARDLVFTCIASNQLLLDNAIALDTLLTTLFREGMAWFYDYYILRGNGAGQPSGLLKGTALGDAALQQVSTGSAVFTLTDAANMMSHLLATSWGNGVWIMHPSVLPQLVTMTTGGSTDASFLVWLNPMGSGNEGPAARNLPIGFFMGLPIIFTEKLPPLAAGSIGSVILADLSKQLVGDRLAVQIESSPIPYFTTNQTVWRVVARWDSKNWLNGPITLADTSSTYQVSSVVVHKAATS